MPPGVEGKTYGFDFFPPTPSGMMLPVPFLRVHHDF